MAEVEEHQKNLPQTNQKPHHEDHEEEVVSVTDDYYFNDGQDEDDGIDPQETYLLKLKEQRKRIQDLSFTVENYKYKYEEQVKRSKYLEAQLSKHQNLKISTIRYEEVNTQLQSISEQNSELRETIQKLRRQNMDLTSDLALKISKQEKEFNNQRKKDQARIEALIQKFNDKQEQYEKLEKELRKKQKEIVELTNSFSSKTKKITQQYEERIINQQRKVEKVEQKNQSNQINQIQQNLAQLQRHNSRLRQQNNYLRDQLQQQQKHFASQAEKLKVKLGRLKKKFDEKEKECDQFKSALNKFERQRKDFSSEREQIINISSKKVQESTIRITSLQTAFNNQKRLLKSQIERHEKTIQGLLQIKKDSLEKIKELQLIIKRKQENERHRKSMLKSEMKEIDKLQKVIDRIVQ